jgi:hypothetical protein
MFNMSVQSHFPDSGDRFPWQFTVRWRALRRTRLETQLVFAVTLATGGRDG